jgi:hypothetical protein
MPRILVADRRALRAVRSRVSPDQLDRPTEAEDDAIPTFEAEFTLDERDFRLAAPADRTRPFLDGAALERLRHCRAQLKWHGGHAGQVAQLDGLTVP